MRTKTGRPFWRWCSGSAAPKVILRVVEEVEPLGQRHPQRRRPTLHNFQGNEFCSNLSLEKVPDQSKSIQERPNRTYSSHQPYLSENWLQSNQRASSAPLLSRRLSGLLFDYIIADSVGVLHEIRYFGSDSRVFAAVRSKFLYGPEIC